MSKIVDAIGFMILSTIDLLVLPRDLSTVIANDVSKFYIINAYGRGFHPNFLFLFPGGTIFGASFSPGPVTIVLSWGVNYLCGLWGP